MKKVLASTLTLVCLGFGVTNAYAGYDLPYVGDERVYVADEDDTLVHIARAHGLGFVEMRAANPNVDPWVPGAGTELILPSRHILPDAPHSGVVINLPEMRLYAYMNGDNAPTTFPLGIGREGLETPIGMTTVVRKLEGPIWRPTARMRREDPSLPAVVHPGPDNPMGTHALYLGWPSYAMHGTDKPYGIGRRSSSGCLRLYPENITELYKMVPVGTKVTVVNQPIKLAWINDVLYMEAHPDMEQAIQMEETGQVFSAKMTDQDMAFIVNAAGEYKNRLHWATVRNEVRNRTGRPVVIARREGASIPSDEPEVIYGRNLKTPSVQEEVSAEALAPPEEQQAAQADNALDEVYGTEDKQDEALEDAKLSEKEVEQDAKLSEKEVEQDAKLSEKEVEQDAKLSEKEAEQDAAAPQDDEAAQESAAPKDAPEQEVDVDSDAESVDADSPEKAAAQESKNTVVNP